MDNDKTTEPCKRHDCKRVRAEMRAVVERVQAERDAALAECNEQARLNGMGAEREARLMAEVERLRKLVQEQDALREDVDALQSVAAALMAERDTLAKDAARYRWLAADHSLAWEEEIDAAMAEGER